MLAQLLRFAIVGTAGFGLDTALLYLGMWLLGLGPYSARLISFLVAASATWVCNRVFTFGDADQSDPWRQWRRYLATNAVGGAVNYGTYAAIVAMLRPDATDLSMSRIAAPSLSRACSSRCLMSNQLMRLPPSLSRFIRTSTQLPRRRSPASANFRSPFANACSGVLLPSGVQ